MSRALVAQQPAVLPRFCSAMTRTRVNESMWFVRQREFLIDTALVVFAGSS